MLFLNLHLTEDKVSLSICFQILGEDWYENNGIISILVWGYKFWVIGARKMFPIKHWFSLTE